MATLLPPNDADKNYEFITVCYTLKVKTEIIVKMARKYFAPRGQNTDLCDGNVGRFDIFIVFITDKSLKKKKKNCNYFLPEISLYSGMTKI